MTTCKPLDREIDLIDMCKMLIGKLFRILICAVGTAILFGGWNVARGIGKPEFSLSAAVKKAVVGGILGFLAAVIVYCLIYLLNGKIKTAKELLPFGLPLFGVIPVFPRKKTEAFAEKLFGGKLPESAAEAQKLTAKLETTFKNNDIHEIALVGDTDSFSAEIENLFAKLPQVDAEFVGDITEAPDAVRKLTKGKNVLLVISEKSTGYAKIDEILSLCSLQGVNLIGYVAFV